MSRRGTPDGGKRSRRAPRVAIAAAVALALACSRAPNPATSSSRPVPSASTASAAPDGAAPSAALPVDAGPAAPTDYAVLVTDREALSGLEARGASFGEVVDAARYGSLAKVIEADVEEAHKADAVSGVGIAPAHRLFDVRFLRSKEARFELVGVTNRLDRLHVDPTACGEVRFVYRLAYKTNRNGTEIASRLPVTLAVSFWQRRPGDTTADGCRAVAARWKMPSDVAGASIAAWLTSAEGPIGPVTSLHPRFKSVEANVQIVRWPSTTRGDMAGHAEYLLRAFVPRGDRLAPGPLENTPDVKRIAKDPTLRADLVKWLGERDNFAKVDLGTSLLPEKFLATRAISVSPRGLARRANRPFRQLFAPADLKALDASASRRFVTSPAALVRRLDELSCQGCHQSRSVAGFHLLGETNALEHSVNAIILPSSPHLAVDVARRQRRVSAIAAGADGDPSAPLAERGADEPGRWGAHCGLGDPGFATWTCAAGLACLEDDVATDDLDVGVCLTDPPAIGGPCEVGRIRPDADGHRDRSTNTSRPCGGGAACEPNFVGFPGGMCESRCGAGLPKDAVCTGIPALTGFNQCLGKSQPFEKCLLANANPAAVRACAADAPCRDDYACARTAEDRGACMPPYFLLQLRVDGHP